MIGNGVKKEGREAMGAQKGEREISENNYTKEKLIKSQSGEISLEGGPMSIP